MRTEQAAVVAKLKAAWPQGRVYDVGAVPASPITAYLDVAVASGSPVNYRHGSRHSSLTFRAVVRSFGRDVNEVAFAAEKADAALLDERIAAGYTPCRRELSTAVTRDPDAGGLLMTVHTYTFTKPA